MQHQSLFCTAVVALPARLSCSALGTRSLAPWALCVSAWAQGLSCQTVSPWGQEGLTACLTVANLRPLNVVAGPRELSAIFQLCQGSPAARLREALRPDSRTPVLDGSRASAVQGRRLPPLLGQDLPSLENGSRNVDDKWPLTNQLVWLPKHFKICSPTGEKLQMSWW